jgi:hypothetical protein
MSSHSRRFGSSVRESAVPPKNTVLFEVVEHLSDCLAGSAVLLAARPEFLRVHLPAEVFRAC